MRMPAIAASSARRASIPRPRPGRSSWPNRRNGRWRCGCSGSAAAVRQAGENAEPHLLASFLFEVASAFTTFYEQCPVLNAPGEAVRDSRLALSALTLRVLDTGLGLLGIPVPERM